MDQFSDLLDRIAKRPAMFVGVCSLSRVANFLDGYCLAMEDLGCKTSPLHGWMDWVELRFGICHSAWHWSRILLHHHGSDHAAIEALPGLFRDFVAERDQAGLVEILAHHERAFRKTEGYRVPSSTTTGSSFS